MICRRSGTRTSRPTRITSTAVSFSPTNIKNERYTTTNPTAGPDTAASAGTRPRACTACAPIRLQPKRPASARYLVRMSTLREVIHENVRGGELYEKLDRNWVRCFACGHCCKIPDGQPGVCKVRYNRDGTLFVPWGYVGGIQCDPIEKKPFFDAHPGALAYSFGNARL